MVDYTQLLRDALRRMEKQQGTSSVFVPGIVEDGVANDLSPLRSALRNMEK
jgi:hypothetical protein